MSEKSLFDAEQAQGSYSSKLDMGSLSRAPLFDSPTATRGRHKSMDHTAISLTSPGSIVSTSLPCARVFGTLDAQIRRHLSCQQ